MKKNKPMKAKLLFITAILIMISSFSSAQETNIKNFNLKDYVAPDIKYRTLDVGTNLSMSGYNQSSDDNQNSFGFNARLDYFDYRNTRKIQSRSYSHLYTSFNSSWSKSDGSKGSNSSPSAQFNYLTETRLYNENKAFLGLHGDLNLYYTNSNSKDESYYYSYNHYKIEFTPYISGGKGRIEPVESARQALDILISLQKYGRLSKTPDSSMIDSLARVANRIRYKRFFDTRYKRIYQLEELDQAIQSMDMVDVADIVYFANLSDIWNWAPTYARGSGLRIEGGIIPTYRYVKFDSKDDYQGNINNSTTKLNIYGAYGFFALNRNRPVNYKWQSDIALDLTFGYAKEIEDRSTDGTNKNESESLKGILNFNWQFGYYPNTRTFTGITPYIATSFVDTKDSDNEKFGINTGIRFDSYYYISPRVRITLEASTFYRENFANSVPSPFWNTNYARGSGYINPDRIISYEILFKFSYAIL